MKTLLSRLPSKRPENPNHDLLAIALKYADTFVHERYGPVRAADIIATHPFFAGLFSDDVFAFVVCRRHGIRTGSLKAFRMAYSRGHPVGRRMVGDE